MAHAEPDIGIAPEADEDEEMHEPPPSSPAFELRKSDFKSSTKLNALIAHLRKPPPLFQVISGSNDHAQRPVARPGPMFSGDCFLPIHFVLGPYRGRDAARELDVVPIGRRDSS